MKSRLNLYLPTKQIKAIKIAAVKAGVSVSEIVKNLLDDYLKDND